MRAVCRHLLHDTQCARSGHFDGGCAPRLSACTECSCGCLQVCLLSTRAGGAGLNLIGANHLVRFHSSSACSQDVCDHVQ